MSLLDHCPAGKVFAMSPPCTNGLQHICCKISYCQGGQRSTPPPPPKRSHGVEAYEQGEGVAEGLPLPALPSNARMVFHDNRCFDWGTFGWALTAGIQNVAAYKHIIFMNSSVRGPFLPPYWPVSFLPSGPFLD